MADNTFHHSFFHHTTTQQKSPSKPVRIPQTSIQAVQNHPAKNKSSEKVTIFGYSAANHQNVIALVKRCGNVTDIEYNSNYMRISYDYECGYERLMEYNRKMVGGEMLGVFRERWGAVGECFVRKKGVLVKIIEYLFGSG